MGQNTAEKDPTICRDRAQTSNCAPRCRPQPLPAIFTRKDLRNYASLDVNSNKQVWWAEGIQLERDANLFVQFTLPALAEPLDGPLEVRLCSETPFSGP